MKKQSAYFFVFLILLVGCKEEEGKPRISSSGHFGEVVVRCSDGLWNSTTGEVLQNALMKNQYGLTQDEPIFNLIQTSERHFKTTFKTYRNVVVINIDTNQITNANLNWRSNVWAKNQLVAEFNCPDIRSCNTLIENKSEQLTQYFNQKEIERLITRNKEVGNKALTKEIKEKLGLSTAIQKDAYLASSSRNHAWIRIERERPVGGYQHQISQGIIFYTFEYEDRLQFSDSFLLNKVDSLMLHYVPGPAEGAYMHIDRKNIEPIVKDINYKNTFARELRGIWRMEKYLMGGPFVAVLMLDEAQNKLILACGYVYAPQFDKREFLRETEAMIKSIAI